MPQNIYEVTITETLQRKVSVSAESAEETEVKVTDRWNKSEIILNADDFVGVDYKAKLIKPVQQQIENSDLEAQIAKQAEKAPTEFSIYQIDMDRDIERVCFLKYDSLEKFQNSKDVNASIYNKVYEGEMEVTSLDAIYERFNTNHPAGYIGRSLSVSDVVEIKKSNEIDPGFYFVDSIGFKKIVFDKTICKQTQPKVELLGLYHCRITNCDYMHYAVTNNKGIRKDCITNGMYVWSDNKNAGRIAMLEKVNSINIQKMERFLNEYQPDKAAFAVLDKVKSLSRSTVQKQSHIKH
ncbi:MAG: YodL domain-containing protein [Acutalibacteraceae bacterium]